MCTRPRIGSCSRRRRSSRAWRAAPPLTGGGAASASAPGSTSADGAAAYQYAPVGMCVVDVGKDAPQLAWIDCRRDLLPRAVQWNSAGMWLGVEGQGLLLLGM